MEEQGMIPEIDPMFRVHMLNKKGKQRAEVIAATLNTCLKIIEPVSAKPDSREWSLFKTHLEIACFFAKKAMANRSENQLPDCEKCKQPMEQVGEIAYVCKQCGLSANFQ